MLNKPSLIYEPRYGGAKYNRQPDPNDKIRQEKIRPEENQTTRATVNAACMLVSLCTCTRQKKSEKVTWKVR
jgi:hypothetical protein